MGLRGDSPPAAGPASRRYLAALGTLRPAGATLRASPPRAAATRYDPAEEAMRTLLLSTDPAGSLADLVRMAGILGVPVTQSRHPKQ